MKRLVKGFMWLVVFMFLLLVLDQVLLRYQGFERPFLRDVQEFHADFRQRLFGLPGLQHSDPEPASGSKPGPSFGAQGSVQTSVDAVVEREITRATQQISTESSTDSEDGSLRYIYVDAEQNIHFAERYQDIPPQFRDAVQVVGE